MTTTPITTISLQGCPVDVLRLELAYPDVQGNKFFKLKYNLSTAVEHGYRTILTFGGAFSNHVHATATACKQLGLHAIFIIRGEDDPDNPTCRYVRELGMEMQFIHREEYKLRNDPAFVRQLTAQFGDVYVLPEGGTNALAVQGCAEILSGIADQYDQIVCAVGTGGTLAGIINTKGLTAHVTGVCSLNGQTDTISPSVQAYVQPHAQNVQWKICFDSAFGKYAGFHPELHAYMQQFIAHHAIIPDPIYNGKMFYQVEHILKTGAWKNQRILCIHTGGLQGWEGWHYRYRNKIAQLEACKN